MEYIYIRIVPLLGCTLLKDYVSIPRSKPRHIVSCNLGIYAMVKTPWIIPNAAKNLSWMCQSRRFYWNSRLKSDNSEYGYSRSLITFAGSIGFIRLNWVSPSVRSFQFKFHNGTVRPEFGLIVIILCPSSIPCSS